MTNRRVSKIIEDERVADLGNGFTVFYGSRDNSSCDVIEVSVKGFFTPVSERTNYQTDAESVCKAMQRKISEFLLKADGIDSHHIVTTDFTGRGIRMGKRCKLKYQMYIRPLEKGPIGSHEGMVMGIVSEVNRILSDTLSEFGFSVA